MAINDLLLGILLDWIFGDPYFMPHPVILMGKVISFEEKLAFKYGKNSRDLYIYGGILVFINIFLAVAIPWLILSRTSGLVYKVFLVYSIYQAISARMLHYEAIKVKEACARSLDQGRKRLSYIVGRDTRELSLKEIYQATIETVAENTSDGVIAPLFFICLLGPIGGYLYKMVNTMDSMIGYHTDRYEYLGKVAAEVDDVLNYIPARITAGLMALVSIFFGRFKETIKTIQKYKHAHLSPNAGYPEAAIAGILDIRLGGGHWYFGKFIEKPTIGEGRKEISPEDISKTIYVLYGTEIAMVVFILLISLF